MKPPAQIAPVASPEVPVVVTPTCVSPMRITPKALKGRQAEATRLLLVEREDRKIMLQLNLTECFSE